MKIFFLSVCWCYPILCSFVGHIGGEKSGQKERDRGKESERACNKERENGKQSAKTQSEGEQKIRIYSAAVLSNKMVY